MTHACEVRKEGEEQKSSSRGLGLSGLCVPKKQLLPAVGADSLRGHCRELMK